MKNVVINLQI